MYFFWINYIVSLEHWSPLFATAGIISKPYGLTEACGIYGFVVPYENKKKSRLPRAAGTFTNCKRV